MAVYNLLSGFKILWLITIFELLMTDLFIMCLKLDWVWMIDILFVSKSSLGVLCLIIWNT